MKLIILGLVLLGAINCDNYAVLVAGSDGYENYRHQSNVFHFYQILKSRGIKSENIIVFAVDDIANNSENPFPGKMFNKPNGNDNYGGVIIDYYGDDVNPENFIAAITQDKAGIHTEDKRSSGKVLSSTGNDNVFIYFTDHGSNGLICFPSKNLYADELNQALNLMADKKMFKELVFYLEASYSGSMFDDILPDNIHIYAATADSNAYYCDEEAIVNGTLIGSCLGDEFSIRFLEDIDAHPGDKLKGYTFQQQYEYLIQILEGSHINQYGDLTIGERSLYEFINAPEVLKFLGRKIKAFSKLILPSFSEKKTHKIVENDEYRLHYYKKRAERTNNLITENEYYEELLKEARSQNIFNQFKQKFNLQKRNFQEKPDFDCYRAVVKSYDRQCGYFIDRDFKYMTYIANFCTQKINPILAEDAFSEICSK